MGENGSVSLPPGFHFHPTDEELILHFLYPKSFLSPPNHQIIPELHFLSHPPWELHGKALASGNQWYFFSSQLRGSMETGNGYWKSSEAEEPIFAASGVQVGTKIRHEFCVGQAPAGVPTNWVMYEYSLCNYDRLGDNVDGASHSSRRRRKRRNQNTDCSRWVLCRVHEEDGNCQRCFQCDTGDEDENDGSGELSCLDEIFLSLDDDFDETSLPKW